MTKLLETLKNINLKEIVKEAIIANGAQVVKSEQWLDLDYDHSGNTFNNNAPLVINVKTIFAADESKTLAFLTFHNGGDPRGNYEDETYILQGDAIHDDQVTIYSGEGGYISYNWNTGETEYRNDRNSELWTIDPEACKIRHTEGSDPAPYTIIEAILNHIYGADLRDFTLDND